MIFFSFFTGVGITSAVFYYNNHYFIETGKKYQIIDECRQKIKESQYPDFDEQKAYVGAINGYLKSGVDKFTSYSNDNNSNPIDEMKNYVNSSGTAIASGFQIDCNSDGNIIICEITEGLTADKQGLKKNDVILSINGNDVSETGFENIANKLMGKQDTVVNLKILRDNKEFEIDFKRDNIIISDLEYKNINEIGYIRIKSFHQMIKGRFNKAIEDFNECKSIIFDLRENSGGDGDTVMNLASQVVGDVEVTKYYYTGKKEVETCKNQNICTTSKIILLVNNNTASAAEIFTALLKQYGKDVTIVGTKTYGKGIFQIEDKLSDGGTLHYTAGYYTVGDWKCYQDVGISPDIEIPMDNSLIGTDDDIQLKKAIEILKK